MNITKAHCLNCSKAWPNPPVMGVVMEARKRSITKHIKTSGHTVRFYQEIGQDVSTVNLNLISNEAAIG